jgi:hypothetical protein
MIAAKDPSHENGISNAKNYYVYCYRILLLNYQFFKLTGVAAAGGALSLTVSRQAVPQKISSINPRLPDKAFWKTVQNQFILDPKQIYMNIGTTGAMPRRILENYERYNHVIARHPMGFMDELGWEIGIPKQREKLGKQFGCTMDEISPSRNTTDGLNDPPRTPVCAVSPLCAPGPPGSGID